MTTYPVVLFSGLDASGKIGLWVTDGTATGTYEITGVTGVDSYFGIAPTDLTSFNGEIFFSGLPLVGGADLWVTDGTANGTHELTGAFPAGPTFLTVFDNQLLFDAINTNGYFGLWTSDGTASGTYELTITGTHSTGLYPYDLTAFNNELLFSGQNASGNWGLWVSDGTAAGTHELTGIADANPNGIFSLPTNPFFSPPFEPYPDLTVFDSKVLFDGLDAGGQHGLWVTDGTIGGTYEILGISGAYNGPGFFVGNGFVTGLNPSDLTVFNQSILFTGFDDNGQVGLWITDGSAAGTHELLGITGANSFGVEPNDLTVFDGQVFFDGHNSNGESGLWVTDGTAGGTHELTGIIGSSSYDFFPHALTVLGNQLLFDAQDSGGYFGLWVSDGTAAGTHELTGIDGASSLGLLEIPTSFVVFAPTNVNQSPVIDTAQSVLTGLLSEQVDVTGSPLLDYANGNGPPSGVIAFSDPDTGDRPTAMPSNLELIMVAYIGANGGNDTSQLSQIDPNLVSDLKSGFTIAAVPGNTNTGKINWTYTVPDAELDFLGVGETITVTVPVQIDDGHGGTVTQSVVITINGANDTPVARPDSATVQKGWTLVADAAHGVLANDSDPDIHDWLSVTAINGITDDVANPFGVTGKYGTLWMNSDGSYRYAANPTLRSATKSGSAQDKFTYTISDGHTGFVTSTLTVNVATQVSIPTAEAYYAWEGARSDDPNSGGLTPPDNALAAGAGMLVSAENDEILLSDLQGGKSAPESLAKFFFSKLTPDFSNYFLGDPTAIYDPDPNFPKFFVSLDEFATSPATQLDSASHTLFAASTTSTPTLGVSKWRFNSVDTSYILQGQATFADQPRFAVDHSYIYMTTDQVPAETTQPTISELTVISKSNLAYLANFDLGGLPYLGTARSYQPTIDPQGGCFYVGHGSLFAGSFDRNYLSIAHSTGTSAPVLANPVYLGPIDSGTLGYIAYDPSGSKIDAGDGRITSAVVAGNFLYTVFEVQPSKLSPPAAEWAKINLTDPQSNVETGYIDGKAISQGAATYNGSIAVDKNSDVLINFSASGPDLAIGDYFVIHHSGDPDMRFSTPVAYTPGDSYGLYSGAARSGQASAWGDYSTAIADPNHPNGFYISNEYSTGLATWSTASAEVLLPQQPSGVNTILSV